MKTDLVFKYGFFVLLAVIAILLMLDNRSDGSKLYIDTLHEKIERYEKEKQRKQRDFDSVRAELLLKEDTILTLRKEITVGDRKYNSAIRYYEKRINNIDKLSDPELDSAFAERYQWVWDSLTTSDSH